MNYNQITGKYYEKETQVESKESEFKFNIKESTSNNNSKLKNFVFSNKNKESKESKDVVKEEKNNIDNIFDFNEADNNAKKEIVNNNLLDDQFVSQSNQIQNKQLDDIFSQMTIQEPKEKKSNQIVDIFQDLNFN